MMQIILSQDRGTGNRPAFYVIDRRVPAMQVPAFYVTSEEHATRMSISEALGRIASNEELRNRINSGFVTVNPASEAPAPVSTR